MNLPGKISRITPLTKPTRRVPSICPNSMSNNVTVFHALFMQELSESDPKPEEIETPDTPPSSETPRMKMLRLVDLLFQLQTWLETTTTTTKTSKTEPNEYLVREQ